MIESRLGSYQLPSERLLQHLHKARFPHSVAVSERNESPSRWADEDRGERADIADHKLPDTSADGGEWSDQEQVLGSLADPIALPIVSNASAIWVTFILTRWLRHKRFIREQESARGRSNDQDTHSDTSTQGLAPRQGSSHESKQNPSEEKPVESSSNDQDSLQHASIPEGAIEAPIVAPETETTVEEPQEVLDPPKSDSNSPFLRSRKLNGAKVSSS